MRYCFIAKMKVYGCDHYECNRKTGSSQYGTKINGMRWCAVRGTHVYSCDHYECNK